MEKRVPLDVQACLGSNEQLLAAERAITVNVGPCGARAIARLRLVDQAVVDGVEGQLEAVGDAEFVEDVMQMVLDSLL